jgi:hypothetical protein
MKWWLVYNVVGQLICFVYSVFTHDWMPTYSWVLGSVLGFLGVAGVSLLMRKRKHVSQD